MNVLQTLSALILISCFILVSKKRPLSYIRTFRMQSLLIGFVALIIGFENYQAEGEMELVIIGIIVIVMKVFYIPKLLRKMITDSHHPEQKDYFHTVPIHILACCGLYAFMYFTFASIPVFHGLQFGQYMVNSISVVLIGFYFMMSRLKALGQIVGFLVLENGIFISAIFATNGMPFIVDLGILVDLITAVLIMGAISFRLDEHFSTADTQSHDEVRG